MSKVDADWTWSGQVGDEPVSNNGPGHKTADGAQAFGKAACRDLACAQLAPHAVRARLELELVQA